MASYFYAPGAIEHYVKLRSGTTYYLGTAVTAPEIEGRPFYLNIINDIGGRSAPMNKVGDREQDIVTTTLNRFDYAVVNSILATGPAGEHNTRTQGTLTFEDLDFELIFVYAAALAGYTSAGFPVGRRYYTSQVIGYKESTVGTRVEEITLVIECNELFIPSTREFKLYSEDTSIVTNGLPVAT